MNPWPGERSVMVMDNCRIHHNTELVDLVNAAGVRLPGNVLSSFTEYIKGVS